MTKPILISGASSGIGTAAAIRLANDGFAVYAGVRNDVDARAVAALHRNIHSVTLDVTNDVSIRDATERAASEDTLVGVICNAGIALGGPLERVAMERLRRQFEVNVFGALALAQAALRYVPERQGRIVS